MSLCFVPPVIVLCVQRKCTIATAISDTLKYDRCTITLGGWLAQNTPFIIALIRTGYSPHSLQASSCCLPASLPVCLSVCLSVSSAKPCTRPPLPHCTHPSVTLTARPSPLSYLPPHWRHLLRCHQSWHSRPSTLYSPFFPPLTVPFLSIPFFLVFPFSTHTHPSLHTLPLSCFSSFLTSFSNHVTFSENWMKLHPQFLWVKTSRQKCRSLRRMSEYNTSITLLSNMHSLSH